MKLRRAFGFVSLSRLFGLAWLQALAVDTERILIVVGQEFGTHREFTQRVISYLQTGQSPTDSKIIERTAVGGLKLKDRLELLSELKSIIPG